MPEPLDYQNPKNLSTSVTSSTPQIPSAHQVIPPEFDALVTRSQDHGGAAAVERALVSRNIPCFRRNDAGSLIRPSEVYVRADDRPRAMEIAAGIFERRRKLK